MPQGPTLVLDTPALQLGLLRLGQRVSSILRVQNLSQLPAEWQLRESAHCLEERGEAVSWGSFLGPQDPGTCAGAHRPLRPTVALA